MIDDVIAEYNRKVFESKLFLRRCGYTILSNEEHYSNNNKIEICIVLMVLFSFTLGIAACKLVGTL